MFWRMESNPQLTVIIVNYNTKDLLLECLASVFESAQSATMESVVVDNASSDGSCEAIRKAYPNVTTIANGTNRGFGAACNQAISATAAPLILLLNSDARLNPSALNALRNTMRLHPRCGGAGCRMVNSKGTEQTSTWNFLTPFNHALELFGLTENVRSPLFRRTHRPVLDRDLLDCSVDWIDASCLMLRRSALEEVDLFDEQFFMYSEDEDLCLRLRRGGWSVCFSAAGSAFHHGGASTTHKRLEMLEHYYSGQLRLLRKYRGRGAARVYSVLMSVVLRAKKVIYRCLPGKARAEEFTERLSALRQACSTLTQPEQ
jgi:GT2 family glycosyltransferase